jgi:hypothetical protein
VKRAKEEFGYDCKCKDQPNKEDPDQNVKYPMHNKNPFKKEKSLLVYHIFYLIARDFCKKKPARGFFS